MTLKDLLGSSYHEGMTLEEAEKALNGKNLADLSTGRYVDIDKYNGAVSDLAKAKKDHEDSIAKYKNYDELVKYKADNEAKIADDALRGKLKEAGFKDEFIDFGMYQLKSGKIVNDDKIVENAKAFLGENPNYGNAVEPQPNPQPNPTINTKVGNDEGGDANIPKTIKTQPWNNNRS